MPPTYFYIAPQATIQVCYGSYEITGAYTISTVLYSAFSFSFTLHVRLISWTTTTHTDRELLPLKQREPPPY